MTKNYQLLISATGSSVNSPIAIMHKHTQTMLSSSWWTKWRWHRCQSRITLIWRRLCHVFSNNNWSSPVDITFSSCKLQISVISERRVFQAKIETEKREKLKKKSTPTWIRSCVSTCIKLSSQRTIQRNGATNDFRYHRYCF